MDLSQPFLMNGSPRGKGLTMISNKMLLAVSAAALALSAQAATAQTVKVENAVARLVYMPENRSDIAVEISQGSSNLPAPTVTRTARGVEINGGVNGRGRTLHSYQCNGGSRQQPPERPGEGVSVTVRGYGRIEAMDAPLIVVRGPRDIEINTGGAVYGAVGRGADNVKVRSGGCGDWVIANVTGNTDIAVGGSGRFWAGRADNVRIAIGGSGDVNVSEAGSLDVSIGGSGDVKVMQLTERANIAIAGSGDVQIVGGNIDSLSSTIAGSGDIDFGGTTRDLSVNIMGAGDVRVNRVTGNISRRVMGVGKVIVADQR